mgnify:FL=1
MSLLNDDQKNAIIDILKEQCCCIQKANALERDMFPNLYDAQYMSGRHHSNTAKVYAGFQEDTLIPGMMIKKISYGVQMWQPEISSDIAVIQLYNDSACKELKTNEVRSKCALYNQCGSQKRYGIIRFKLTDKGLLQWVKLINFDEKAEVVHEEELYRHIGKTIPFAS